MSIRSLFAASALLLLPLAAQARHSHHHDHVHFQARDVVIPVVAAGTTVASTTAAASDLPGDAAIEDIQDIQQGLENLPKDLLSFVQGVEARLQTIEDLLEAMISGPSSSSPSSITPIALPSPYPTDFGEDTSSTPRPTSAIPSTTNHSSLAPTSTTSFDFDITSTTTRTTRITQTNTRTITPIPISASIRPYNGTTNATLTTGPASGGVAITYTISLALTGPYETTLQTQTRAARTPVPPPAQPAARGL